ECERPNAHRTVGEASDLTHVPQVGSRFSGRQLDPLAISLDEIAADRIAIPGWQQDSQDLFGPGWRRGLIHMRPFSGHSKPFHSFSIWARASFRARRAGGCRE